MKKYMLISVYERNILTEQFDTLEAAHTQMMNELKKDLDEYDYEYDVTWDEIVNKEKCSDYEDFGFGIDWAWSNIDDNCNCDWKIVEVK